MGTGVSRIVETCKTVGLPEPEYGTDGAFVWITFKRPNSVTKSDALMQHIEETTQKTTQKLSKKQEEIFAFLKNNPKLLVKTLQRTLQV